MNDPRHPTERLSEYLDGGLGSVDRREVADHLAGCPTCAATLADLEAITRAAAALEEQPPTNDLWPGIERRLGTRTAEPEVVPFKSSRRRISFTWPELAAAAVLLLLAGAAGVWTLGDSGRPDPSPNGPVAASGPATGTTLVSSGGPDAGYEAAIADLERAFRENRYRLDPTTVRTVESNLAAIDAAIEEIRRALEDDPADPWLHSHLARTLRTKVDVLQDATQATRTT